MNKLSRILLALILFFGPVLAARAAATGSGPEAFEKLKSLSGHWEEQTPTDALARMDIRLTSGGTTLIEVFDMVDQGKPVEMVTMYYLDGGQLKMTHYCEAGNQPTMRATYSPDAKTLTWDFISATNLKTPHDGHMHHAVYTFVDRDHLKTVWTFQKNQKESFTEESVFVRK